MSRNRLFEKQDNNIVEQDNIYYNVIIDHSAPIYTNATISGQFNDQPEQAKYSVTLDQEVLHKSNDFYCSVVRFAIPLDTVPLMICEVQPNQSNVNLTPFYLGINYNGTNYGTFLIYVPQNTFQAPLQNQPTPVVTDYYFIYSYTEFINMMNTALSTIWISSGLAALFTTSTAPYFTYNNGSQPLNLIIPTCFIRTTSPATSVPTLFMNTKLETYLTSFPSFFNGNNTVTGNDYTFQFGGATPYYPAGITSPATATGPIPAANYYDQACEYSTLPFWNALRKVVLLSNTLCIRNEGIPSGFSNQSGLPASLNIISDFIPNIDFSGDSRSICYYNPSAQYKLVDIITDLPTRKIDIVVFWQDRDQTLWPLYLSTYQIASIKLGFFRKNLYKKFNYNQ